MDGHAECIRALIDPAGLSWTCRADSSSLTGTRPVPFRSARHGGLVRAGGGPDATVFNRRISPATQRQALTMALLAVAIVALPTLWMTALSPFSDLAAGHPEPPAGPGPPKVSRTYSSRH